MRTWWVLGMSILLRRNFLRCMTVMAAGHCRYLLFATWNIYIYIVDINNLKLMGSRLSTLIKEKSCCTAGNLQSCAKGGQINNGNTRCTRSPLLKTARAIKFWQNQKISTWSFDCLSSPRPPSLKTKERQRNEILLYDNIYVDTLFRMSTSTHYKRKFQS